MVGKHMVLSNEKTKKTKKRVASLQIPSHCTVNDLGPTKTAMQNKLLTALALCATPVSAFKAGSPLDWMKNPPVKTEGPDHLTKLVGAVKERKKTTEEKLLRSVKKAKALQAITQGSEAPADHSDKSRHLANADICADTSQWQGSATPAAWGGRKKLNLSHTKPTVTDPPRASRFLPQKLATRTPNPTQVLLLAIR